MPKLSVLVLAVMIIVFHCGVSASGDARKRGRRSVLQFSQMVRCATGRSALWDYNGYGCWCGVGGRGTPVDGTDRCCKVHDECYDGIKRDCSESPYWTNYRYSKYNCESGSPWITCDDGWNSCKRRLCECDRQAALCFAKQSFNSRYRSYSNANC
ncbi:acidic phospholipase A2-like [Diadema setosum]|uniref:acidic phospholipase A2-like n=1 Tax=Diadema setosum TaxID=31175 RepID=UPI003B3B0E10